MLKRLTKPCYTAKFALLNRKTIKKRMSKHSNKKLGRGIMALSVARLQLAQLKQIATDKTSSQEPSESAHTRKDENLVIYRDS